MTLPLFAYQDVAANVMSGRERFGLHDEMGIGKTATTIGAYNNLLAERGIIVAPAMLRENWIKEFKRFSTYPVRLCKGKNIHDYIAWERGRFDVLVTSYELATKWTPRFLESGEVVDFMAFDEAHYLKNVEANRTRAILGVDAGGDDGLVQRAVNAYHVTGTPMANDPMDAYTFLRFAQSIGDMPPAEFTERFFDKTLGAWGARHSVKPEMLSILQQLLANNSIRRTHAQVGMELPPIFLKEVLIEGDTSEIAEAAKDYPHLEQQIVAAIEANNLSLLDAPHIATLRRLVGKAKALAYAQMLKWELDAGAGKRVAFFWHTEPLLFVQRWLAKYGYKMVVAYGDTNERDRQNAIKQFMEGDAHVFGGNIKVAGVGLTLTASSEIDLVESSWSPADNAQAIKRVHRYGQANSVNARFITLASSIDVGVNKVVARKTANIAEIEGHSMAAAPLDVLAHE